MRNKTISDVQASLEAIRKQMEALQNAQTRHEVLRQFQNKGVTQLESRGFVAGNGGKNE